MPSIDGTQSIRYADPVSQMERRDFFAAMAMQAMISTVNGPCVFGLGGAEEHVAKAAFCMADAMLQHGGIK